LNWIEHYYVIDKIRYTFDKLNDQGIYPFITKIGDERGYPSGVAFHNSVTVVRGAVGDGRWSLGGVQYYKPDLIKDSFLAKQMGPSVWGRWSLDGYQDYGARALLSEVLGTQNNLEVGFRFQSDPREDFFGIGPKTSLGSGFTYDLDETAFNLELNRQLAKHLKGEIGVGFSHFEVSNSHDKSKGEIFRAGRVSGIQNNTDLFYGGAGLLWDTRNDKDSPSRGEFVNLTWGAYGNTTEGDMAYMKYRAEAAKYIDLKKRRVLAGRVFVEYNDNIGDNGIPFFDKAQMGGPRTIRGYQFNRFVDDGTFVFNLEYRYTIWKFRDVELDLYPFWDGGWIFPEFSKLEFDTFKTGYGGGAKFRWLKHGSVSFEVAHSNEGTDFYAKFVPTF
jgi:hypothetical protein